MTTGILLGRSRGEVGLEMEVGDGADAHIDRIDLNTLHDMERMGCVPHHHAALAQLGEIDLEQTFPCASAVQGFQFLLALALVTVALLPYISYHTRFGVIGLFHESYQVTVIFSYEVGAHGTLRYLEVRIAPEELNKASGALAAQTDVIVIRTLGRCGTLYDYAAEHKVHLLDHGDQGVIEICHERVGGHEFSAVHLETQTTSHMIEQ